MKDSFFSEIAKNLLLVIITCFVLIILSSFFVSMSDDPGSLVGYTGASCLFVSSALCGFIIGKRKQDKAVTASLTSVGIFVVLLYFASIVTSLVGGREMGDITGYLALYGITLLLGVLGAFLGKKRKKPMHKKHKHKKR